MHYYWELFFIYFCSTATPLRRKRFSSSKKWARYLPLCSLLIIRSVIYWKRKLSYSIFLIEISMVGTKLASLENLLLYFILWLFSTKVHTEISVVKMCIRHGIGQALEVTFASVSLFVNHRCLSLKDQACANNKYGNYLRQLHRLNLPWFCSPAMWI